MENWEGAELCYYDSESHGIALSDMQFAIIVKILGLQVHPDDTVTAFSDATLEKFMQMESNPLRFNRKQE